MDFPSNIFNILELFSTLGNSLVYTFGNITDMFSYTVTIFGTDYSVWSLLFTTAGLGTFIIVTMIKWFLDIIS